jgi:hypothetical protein
METVLQCRTGLLSSLSLRAVRHRPSPLPSTSPVPCATRATMTRILRHSPHSTSKVNRQQFQTKMMRSVACFFSSFHTTLHHVPSPTLPRLQLRCGTVVPAFRGAGCHGRSRAGDLGGDESNTDSGDCCWCGWRGTVLAEDDCGQVSGSAERWISSY